MTGLKKNVDKGIAYLKKNGIRAAGKRVCRKVRLSVPVRYEAWLKKQLRICAEQMQDCPGVEARIRVVSLSGMPSEIREEEYLLFIEEGGLLEKNAANVYANAILAHPGADLFYCDSDRVSADGRHFSYPDCKPDFDPYYLQSVNYIGGGFLVSGSLARRLESGELLYEYLLRAAALAEEVVHVPHILYHRPEAAFRQWEEEREALNRYFVREGIFATASEGIMPWSRKITYVHETEPLVSILIPNKDHPEDLERCIASIRKFAGYGRYEILIIENNSTTAEIKALYETLEKQEDVRVITYDGTFNYAKINNFGQKQAKGEYLLFLNNDTEMCADGCILEMMNYARCMDVGAVGARMYYGDGCIQHAGVVLGYGGIAGHAFEGLKPGEASRIREIICARTCSAVTAACMMVRRSLFEELGGFDEALGVAYNDIDLCLRIGAAGKKVLYTPFAELFHYESRTRGMELTKEKAERIRKETEYFKQRWHALLEQGDPCYNPNLTLEKSDFSLRI